jgi:hypothetical protein
LRDEQAIEILRKDISGRLLKFWALLHIPFILIIVGGAVLSIINVHFNINVNFNLPASSVSTSSLIPAIYSGVLTACSIIVGFFTVTAYNLRHDFDNYVEKCQDRLRNLTKEKDEETGKEREINLILNIKAFSHQMEHIGKFLFVFFSVFFLNLIIYTFIFMFTDRFQVFVVTLFLYAILFLYSVAYGSFLFLNEFMHYPEHDHIAS